MKRAFRKGGRDQEIQNMRNGLILAPNNLVVTKLQQQKTNQTKPNQNTNGGLTKRLESILWI